VADAAFEVPRLAAIYDVVKSDGAVLTSDSTLRFRTREEVASSLEAAGLTVQEVRDAPDRPGKEMVFFAVSGC
jgi:hypothetical protein